MSIIKNIIKISRPLRFFVDTFLFRHLNKSNDLHHLKNKYLNKTVLIVGNGPSLNNTPLDKLSKFPSIGMNKIDLIFDSTSWRPDHIIVTNNMVIKQHWKSLQIYKEKVILAWKGRYFINFAQRKTFKYFNNFNDYNFSKRFDLGVGSGATVTYHALQLAYYMGASKVILVGVDHNFKTSGDPLDYEKMKEEDVNHFDPNYFKLGQLWGIPDLVLSEENYLAAKKEIIDATVNGKLQVFNKQSINDFL